MSWNPTALRRRHRDGGERGAVLAEAALVFPLIALITFAIIEYGLLFLTQSTSLSAAQDGARLAAAEIPIVVPVADAFDNAKDAVVDDLDALSGQGTPQVLWIYRASANGEPVGGAGFSSCNTDCRRYTWNGSDFVNPQGTWATPDACLFDGDGLESVGVYVRVRHRLISGFLFEATTLDEHTTAQLEPIPSEDC